MYQQMIKDRLATMGRIDVCSNANQIEAWMRLAYGTLDGLGDFGAVVREALDCYDAATPKQSQDLALSYGL